MRLHHAHLTLKGKIKNAKAEIAERMRENQEMREDILEMHKPKILELKWRIEHPLALRPEVPVL